MILKVDDMELRLEYTVEAQKKFEERFGEGKEAFEKLMDTTEQKELSGNMIYMGTHMLNASNHRKKVRAKMVGQDCDVPEDITEEEFSALIPPGIMPKLIKTVMQAILEGTKQNIEVKPSKKNGRATQSE